MIFSCTGGGLYCATIAALVGCFEKQIRRFHHEIKLLIATTLSMLALSAATFAMGTPVAIGNVCSHARAVLVVKCKSDTHSETQHIPGSNTNTFYNVFYAASASDNQGRCEYHWHHHPCSHYTKPHAKNVTKQEKKKAKEIPITITNSSQGWMVIRAHHHSQKDLAVLKPGQAYSYQNHRNSVYIVVGNIPPTTPKK